MRAVIGKDKATLALISKNKNLKNADLVKVKHQVYVLTQKDDEERNVLHVACMSGNRGVLAFLLEVGGAGYLNILDQMNVKDYLGLSPLYWLCNKGHKDEIEKGERAPEHATRHDMLRMLVEI